jgi:hypothetical protein
MINVLEVFHPLCDEVLVTFQQLHEEGMNMVFKNAYGDHNFGSISSLRRESYAKIEQRKKENYYVVMHGNGRCS